MTGQGRGAAGEEPQGRVFYDIAQLLESAEDSEARVVRVLERLRVLVPYERCAVLEARPGREPRLVVAPGTPPEETAGLTATLAALLGRLLEEHGRADGAPSTPGTHLAVPLVGLGEVAGVLFVRGAEGGYGEGHVRALSVVAAKLAAYFSMLRAFALEAERARQLEEAVQAAERANRAKDEFLALVSHELRTPLHAILSWTGVLRSKETREADRTRAFEAIERNVRAQGQLIDDLLDLSCVATATLRLALRPVEPAAVIRAAIRALRPRAEARSIHIEAALDESVTPLLADPHRLGQIVANLVANAIKFTPEGGRVEVRLERAGLRARIRVIDSGTGIRPDVLPHLFAPFRQADSSSRRAYGGLGVGLALVKDLVELHGGSVQAESPGEAQGATFTVELPLAGAAAPPGQPDVPIGGRGDQPALAGIRVLIVNDDPDLRDVLRLVLEGQGALVTLAASAAEALPALERSMPDVLLSDVSLPGQSDYDLMRQIVGREGEGARAEPVLSGYATGRSLRQALASGLRMQLAKPLDPETLIAAVAALAGRARNDPAGPRPA
jgi:signal transduction histidine kinase/ActR/RegA family two-component response regulator